MQWTHTIKARLTSGSWKWKVWRYNKTLSKGPAILQVSSRIWRATSINEPGSTSLKSSSSLSSSSRYLARYIHFNFNQQIITFDNPLAHSMGTKCQAYLCDCLPTFPKSDVCDFCINYKPEYLPQKIWRLKNCIHNTLTPVSTRTWVTPS